MTTVDTPVPGDVFVWAVRRLVGRRERSLLRIKGYDTRPDEYGTHRSIWAGAKCGIVLEETNGFSRVFVDDVEMWVENHKVELLRLTP